MSERREDERSEERAAEALARALEGESTEDEEVGELLRLAERVRASAGFAAPLPPERREVLVAGALEAARPRRRPVLRLFVGALAAAFALFALGLVWLLLPERSGEPTLTASTLAPQEAYAAPTDSLFDGPFPEGQSPAARVDRMLEARTRGYFTALLASRGPAATEPVAAAVGP